MATQEEEKMPIETNEANDEQQTPVTSSRQAFTERIKSRHPELDENDEESFYSAINADYDEDDAGREELKRYKEDDERLRGIFESDPRMANVFLGMARGENVLEYLIDNFGQDFLDAINNPEDSELRDRIAEKQQQWLDRQSKSKELEEQTAANLEKALDAFDAVAEEMGADEEAQEEAFKKYTEFQQRAIVNDIDEDMWRLFFKGTSYDVDVEQAGIEGETRGRNAKIREKLRTPERTPMDMGNGTSGRQEPRRASSIFDLAAEAR